MLGSADMGQSYQWEQFYWTTVLQTGKAPLLPAPTIVNWNLLEMLWN